MMPLIRRMQTNGMHTRVAGNGHQENLSTVTHHSAVAMAKGGERRHSMTTGLIPTMNPRTGGGETRMMNGVANGITRNPVVEEAVAGKVIRAGTHESATGTRTDVHWTIQMKAPHPRRTASGSLGPVGNPVGRTKVIGTSVPATMSRGRTKERNRFKTDNDNGEIRIEIEVGFQTATVDRMKTP